MKYWYAFASNHSVWCIFFYWVHFTLPPRPIPYCELGCGPKKKKKNKRVVHIIAAIIITLTVLICMAEQRHAYTGTPKTPNIHKWFIIIMHIEITEQIEHDWTQIGQILFFYFFLVHSLQSSNKSRISSNLKHRFASLQTVHGVYCLCVWLSAVALAIKINRTQSLQAVSKHETSWFLQINTTTEP